MHFRTITRIVGLLVILFSVTMIIPGLVALIYRDGAGSAFAQTFFLRTGYWTIAVVSEPSAKKRIEISRRISHCGAVLDRSG